MTIMTRFFVIKNAYFIICYYFIILLSIICRSLCDRFIEKDVIIY